MMVALSITLYFIGLILPTDAGSSLTDVRSNVTVDNIGKTNSTDVLRQLLNQETIIRMSLTKDVHTLMMTVVELKEKQLKTEGKVVDLTRELTNLQQEHQNLKLENTMTNKEIKKLKEQSANIQNELVRVNDTFRVIDETILQITENQKAFEVRVQQREKDFEMNTSDVLNDIKIQLRYVSITLLDLNKHTLEIDKNIPQLVENNVRRISEHVNKSIEGFANNMRETQTAITELEFFRSNISTLTTESISKLKEEISQTKEASLKQTAKISALALQANLSSNCMKTRVGFTAGAVSSSSSWSSSVLVFPKVIFDVGGGYNSATGVFTAPVGGDYVFFVTIVANGNNFIYVEISLNGSSKVRTVSHESARYQTGVNMVLLRLKKGDQIWVNHNYGKGYFTYSNVPSTTFSGFML